MKKLSIIGLLFPLVSFSAPNSAFPNVAPNSPWEKVQSPHFNTQLERMSVPHGWLVITYGPNTVTTVFVPDENHEWVS